MNEFHDRLYLAPVSVTSELGLFWSQSDSVFRTVSEPAKPIRGGTASQSHVCNPRFS